MFSLEDGPMIHVGSQAEVRHHNGAHLLLRTYFSDGCYGYTVQNLHGGMPVALCEERFKTAQEAMHKAEEVAARAIGVSELTVAWRATRTIVSRSEQSRIVRAPEGRSDIRKSAC
jgi:hypothetical protein